MRWAKNVAHISKKTMKETMKRPLGRQRCRWVDNIKMDLMEIG
jgi:hypothetical protein